MDAETKQQEQARVTDVIAKIEQRLQDKNAQLDQAHRETTSIERNYGDNTRVNITEADDRIETNAAVQQKTISCTDCWKWVDLKQQISQLKDYSSHLICRIDIDEGWSRYIIYWDLVIYWC